MTTTKPASEPEIAAWLSKDGRFAVPHPLSAKMVFDDFRPLVFRSEAIDTISALTAERDAAFAMSRCQCLDSECCANLVKANAERDAAVAEVARLRAVLTDLLTQVDKFCETEGEADFYTGAARAALHPTQAATSEASRDR